MYFFLKKEQKNYVIIIICMQLINKLQQNCKTQGCHTLKELKEFRETQGIFNSKKISGKLREF